MAFYIRRTRQTIGLIYILLYMVIFITYAFIRNDDQSWTIESKFTVSVLLWFILSLAVKVTMFTNRIFELLNLISIVAFMSIAFTYIPRPDNFSSIENFCYYLNMFGGSAIDLFDFVYEGAAGPPKDKFVGPEKKDYPLKS